MISIYFVYIISFPHVQCVFFSLKCQNSSSDLIHCYSAKCVCLSAYECLHKYIPFLNDQSFHHWQKLVNQIDERNRFPHQIWASHHRRCLSNYICIPVACYCLTLNGRTILIKVHSIDNNTIYVYSIIY